MSQIPGTAIDSEGNTVLDPTVNVRDIIIAANKRQDDLRELEGRRRDQMQEASNRRLDDLRVQEAQHRAQMDRMRDSHDKEVRSLIKDLRTAETARIDAIRAVDVGAVARAAEVSAAQAIALANQVSTSAETLRTQVAASATAAATALGNSLEPIIKRIEELSRVQYEQAGAKVQQVETRGSTQWSIGLALSVAVAVLSVLSLIVYVIVHK